MIARGKLLLREWRESDIAQLLPLRNDVPMQLQLMTRPRPNSGPAKLAVFIAAVDGGHA